MDDLALIAQLQEAHGRATKGEWVAIHDGCYPCDIWCDDSDVLRTGHVALKENIKAIVLSHSALPRLIELAREAILSRAVVEAAKEMERISMLETVEATQLVYRDPVATKVHELNQLQRRLKAYHTFQTALSTLASATRKESA